MEQRLLTLYKALKDVRDQHDADNLGSDFLDVIDDLMFNIELNKDINDLIEGKSYHDTENKGTD